VPLFLVALIVTPIYLWRPKEKTSAIKPRLSVPLSADEIPNETVWGIDISHHQRIIHWNQLTDKPDFIFLKSTEGKNHTDTRFKKYYAQARAKKILCGAYHFFSFRAPGKQQAQHFIENTKLHKGDLAPVLDIERTRKMSSKNEIIKEVNDWLDIVGKHYGVNPILYTDEDFYEKYLKGNLLKDYPLWLCDYYHEPDANWVFWQRTNRFTLSGIHGNIDLNYFRGTMTGLHNLTLNQDCCQ